MDRHDAQTAEGQLRAARTNVNILAAAQALLGAAAPLSISIGGLAGYQLLGTDKSLSTLPVTGFNVGVVFGTVVIAILARQLGRKASFLIGGLIGASGGAVATIALVKQDFWLFVFALLLIGLSGGFAQKIRFAAADLSPSYFKGQAISRILLGGIVSAVLGPQIVIWMKDLIPPFTFAGALLAVIPLMLAGTAILAFVNFNAAPEPKIEGASEGPPPRPLLEIVGTQRFVTGLVCAMGSYALMSFMMTGAPLAMVIGCGFSSELAMLGIQWHVIAMFAPSFVTGMLITRFGAEKVVAAGFIVLMGCAVVAHAGIALWNFWGALVLLGIGWNFAFIGATAIVSASYRPNEADKVQGFHDILLFGTVALSSFSSGQVFTAYGWNLMNLAIWPVAVVCLLLLMLQIRAAHRLAIP